MVGTWRSGRPFWLSTPPAPPGLRHDGRCLLWDAASGQVLFRVAVCGFPSVECAAACSHFLLLPCPSWPPPGGQSTLPEGLPAGPSGRAGTWQVGCAAATAGRRCGAGLLGSGQPLGVTRCCQLASLGISWCLQGRGVPSGLLCRSVGGEGSALTPQLASQRGGCDHSFAADCSDPGRNGPCCRLPWTALLLVWAPSCWALASPPFCVWLCRAGAGQQRMSRAPGQVGCSRCPTESRSEWPVALCDVGSEAPETLQTQGHEGEAWRGLGAEPWVQGTFQQRNSLLDAPAPGDQPSTGGAGGVGSEGAAAAVVAWSTECILAV